MTLKSSHDRQRSRTSKSRTDIRPFQLGDLDELQRIRARAFEPVFRSFRQTLGARIAGFALLNAEQQQEQHLAELCSAEAPQKVFVASTEGKPVGFVSILLDHEQKVGEVGLNAVDPDHAGRGIGTQLYQFALQEMKAAGMKVATVGTGGDPSHAPARRAYEKAGFGPTLPSQWMYRAL